jgi:hypothetical protein
MRKSSIFLITALIAAATVPSALFGQKPNVVAEFYCDSKYEFNGSDELIPFKLDLLNNKNLYRVQKNGKVLVSPATLHFKNQSPISMGQPFATADSGWTPNFNFRDHIVKFEVDEQNMDAEIAWFKFNLTFVLPNKKDSWGGWGAKWSGMCDQRQFGTKTK